MIELRSFSRTGEIEIPPWSISLGARQLPASAVPQCFTSGFALEVPLTDTTRYLDYLAARFQRAGGEIHTGVQFEKIEDVEHDCTLLVNCTGVGAKTLVPDPEVEPHRGQVVIVPKMPHDYAVVCDDPPLMYAIPRANDCVFGGTNEQSEDRNPIRRKPLRSSRNAVVCWRSSRQKSWPNALDCDRSDTREFACARSNCSTAAASFTTTATAARALLFHGVAPAPFSPSPALVRAERRASARPWTREARPSEPLVRRDVSRSVFGCSLCFASTSWATGAL